MTTYYAGVGGNDGNAGTSWALRKLTIQAAVNVATTAGDTIYVGPGTYRETVTMGTSGTAGNVISLIGDYTGANTSGVKGVVRITGSNDDISATRASCIVNAKNYITIRGFVMDGNSGKCISMATSGTDTTIQNCFIDSWNINNASAAIWADGAGQARITVDSCVIHDQQSAIRFYHSVAVDNAGHVIKNCVLSGVTQNGIFVNGIGGITISNCTIYGSGAGRGVSLDTTKPTAGQTITVNNCIISRCSAGLGSAWASYIVENYNTLFAVTTARTNVTAGANSVTRPPLFDARWFFEMVNGGRLVTPFDLASYSTLSEYSSGTGAPSTDLRGASVVGTYREWGALEYDSTLDIEAGSAGGVKTHPGMGGGING